jgi:hypothetical protein
MKRWPSTFSSHTDFEIFIFPNAAGKSSSETNVFSQPIFALVRIDFDLARS